VIEYGGGHAMAAGFSLMASQLEGFRKFVEAQFFGHRRGARPPPMISIWTPCPHRPEPMWRLVQEITSAGAVRRRAIPSR